MKKKLSRKEAIEIISSFFKQDRFDAKNAKKIKRLAMSHRISLGQYRRRFCKKCFSDLRKGRIRISKAYKIIECLECGYRNRWKIS